MTKDEALTLALEALEEIAWSNSTDWQRDRAKVVIPAVKEALAQPDEQLLVANILSEYGLEAIDFVAEFKKAMAQPEQEPVGWMVYTLDGASVCVTDNPADFTSEHRALPLYTTPQQQERNFCPRCGKRLGKNDWDVHTCTPPRGRE